MRKHAIWSLKRWQNVMLDDSSERLEAIEAVSTSIQRWKSVSIVMELIGRSPLCSSNMEHQKGLAEPMNRILLDLVRLMLQCRNLAKFLGAGDLPTATYVRNRVTSWAFTVYKLHHHLRKGVAAVLTHMCVFKSKCWYASFGSFVRKFDSRSPPSTSTG